MTKTAAALAAAFAACAALTFVLAVSSLEDKRAAADGVAPRLRPLASAFQTDIDRTYLLAAKAFIPRGATYYFDQGSGVQSGNTASAQSAGPVTRFWLFPRYPAARPAGAQWLICYGCELGRWHTQVVWQRGPIAIARLIR